MKYLKEFEDLVIKIKPLCEQAEEEKDAGKAMDRLLNKGIMPDGAKWMDIPKMQLGFNNDPEIRKDNKQDKGDTVVFTADVRVAPGKGGGAGIGIDPRTSNQFYNILGTDRRVLKDSAITFTKVAKSNARKLNSDLEKWMREPDNFIHRIVGWEDRNKYKVKDITFKNINYEQAVIDPTRRKWPAGRTEIWVPVNANIIITLEKKP